MSSNKNTNHNNYGLNGGRIVSSFNLGGQGARAGGGAYHIYGNKSGESKVVTKKEYTTYNSKYTHSNSKLYNSFKK
jgi:hypothetical protein